ncbi:MAG: HlyD family efflux transporter periplasmic adaptor subunit [Chloroflexi bacterium]|nr:HlyD family efflux transporter periplasmic adaptor subunit [Chloroflexota bacterium]
MTGRLWRWLVFLVLSALLVGSGTLGCSRLRSSGEPKATSEAVEVQRGNLSLTVSASGSIYFPNTTALSFSSPLTSGAVSGNVVEVDVNIGDQVEEGQTLARINDAPYKKAELQAEANLQSAQIALDKAVTPYTAEDMLRAENDVASARNTLALAKSNLAMAQAQAASNLAAAQQDQAQAEAAVRAAQAALDIAKQSHDLSLQNLSLAQTQAASNLAAAQQDQAQAEAAVRAAQAALDIAKQSHDLSLQNMSLAQTQAASNLAAAQQDQAQAEAAVRAAQAALDLAKQSRDQSQQNLSLAQAQADRNLVTAQGALDKATRVYREQISPYFPFYISDELLFTDPLQLLGTEIYQFLSQRSQINPLDAYQSMVDANGAYDVTHLQGQQSVQAANNAIASAEEAVNKAEDSLAQSQAQLLKIQGATDPTPVTGQLELTQLQGQQSVQAANNAVASAEEAVKKAEDNLAQSQAQLLKIQGATDPTPVTGQLELTQLQGQQSVAATSNAVSQAQETLRRAEADLADKKGGTDAADLALAQSQVSIAQSALDEAKANLEGTALKAPLAGTIASVNITVGSQVGAGTAAITLVDISKIEVNATVDEVDVAQVQVGQQAMVTLDALTGMALPARVKTISTVGQVQAGVVSYSVVLDVTRPASGQQQAPGSVSPGGTPPARQPGVAAGRQGQYGAGMSQQRISGQLREGMTALATIVVEQRSNVLLLPARAVRSSGGKRVVQVVTPSGTVEREVTTGLSDGRNIEVVSGLDEGDKVMVAATATTTTQIPSGGGRFMPGGGMFR